MKNTKTEVKKPVYKVDIFDAISRIDGPRNYQLWNTWSTEEQGGISPLIIMRWMSGTSDKIQIIKLNEFVNPYVFSLANHQELMVQLLHVASSHQPRRYYWQAVKGAADPKKERKKVMMEYYGWSTREMSQITVFPTDEDIVKMAEELGWQTEDVAKLKKEMKG